MNVMGNILYGVSMMLVGLFVVFFMLALLIICITIMSKVFDVIKGNKAKKAEAPKAVAPAPAPAPAPVAEPAPVMEEVNDAQLIAVIAAAIAAFDNSGKQLVVRKVRRVAGWGKTARQEQVYRF